MNKLQIEAQALISCALAAFLVSFLVWRRLSIVSVFGFLALFVTFVLLYHGLVRLLVVLGKMDTATKHAQERLDRARALPISVARERALKLLSDPNQFNVVKAAASVDTPNLGDTTREFFSGFESVFAIRGETRIERSKIFSSALRKGFIRIGSDSDFTEIVTRPGQDETFVVDGTEPSDPPSREGYPTIYHLIVAHYGDNNLGGGK